MSHLTNIATPHIKREIISTNPLSQSFRVAWSPDSQYFAVTHAENVHLGVGNAYSIQIYEAHNRKLIKTLPSEVTFSLFGAVIGFSPNAKYFAAESDRNIVTLWNTKTWEVVRTIHAASEEDSYTTPNATSLVFSPDGKSLAVYYPRATWWPPGIVDKTLENQKDLTSQAHEAAVDGTMWEKRAKGELIEFLDTILVFDVESGKRLQIIKAPVHTPLLGAHFSGNLAYTSDGKYLVTPWTEQHAPEPMKFLPQHFTFLQFRNPKTGEVLKDIPSVHIMDIDVIAASANGQYIATGTSTTTQITTKDPSTDKWSTLDNKDPIRLWNIASGKKVMEFGPILGKVEALSFTPDSRILVSCQRGDSEHAISLWDVASGENIENLLASTHPHGNVLDYSHVFDCAVSPNGHYIVAPSERAILLFEIQHRN